jgi:UDP-2-acetamido-3-amino-2,3-dideoxy-glucuronate N-acetyltransferase
MTVTKKMSAAGPGVAVLGCGGWGMNHVRAWHDLGLLRVACDPDPGRAAAVRSEYPSVDVTSSPEAVWARDDVDAVVIATPAVTHATLALRAIAAGKHVLVEKPLAVSASEGVEVVRAAEAAGRLLMVGHVLEYHPAVLRLRELISDGVLGRILYLYSHRLNFGKVRTEESALWSFAPHDLALCHRIVGAPPVTVTCRGGEYLNSGVADVTMMGLSFPGNVQAHIFVSWLHPFKEHRFVVVGDRQMAVFDDTAPWPEKLRLYPHRVEWLQGRLPVAHRAESIAVDLEEDEPLLAECRHFAEAVASGTAVLTDGASGLAVLEVLDAGERSLRADGAPVSLGAHAGATAGGASYFAHDTATVDDDVEVGEGTRIWHYCHVSSGAVIGDGCSLGQNVFVGRGVHIGHRVKVQNNVSVYEGVEIGDDVFCGPSVVFTNVFNPRAEVERKHEYRATLVGRGASLGANCTIVCGTSIGEYAFVGAGAVVTHDVPPHALVTGVPARNAGWMCRCGEKLEATAGGWSCPACGRQYAAAANGLQLTSPPSS